MKKRISVTYKDVTYIDINIRLKFHFLVK